MRAVETTPAASLNMGTGEELSSSLVSPVSPVPLVSLVSACPASQEPFPASCSIVFGRTPLIHLISIVYDCKTLKLQACGERQC